MDLLQFVRGCTFDDFLFTPQKGLLPRRDPNVIDLTASQPPVPDSDSAARDENCRKSSAAAC
jgi:hypothetical protein